MNNFINIIRFFENGFEVVEITSYLLIDLVHFLLKKIY